MNQFKRSMYLKLIIIVSCLSYILYRFKSVNFNLNTSGSSDSTWTRVSLTRDDFTVLVTSTVYYDDRRNDRRYLRMHWIHSQDTPTAFWHNIRYLHIVWPCNMSLQHGFTDASDELFHGFTDFLKFSWFYQCNKTE